MQAAVVVAVAAAVLVPGAAALPEVLEPSLLAEDSRKLALLDLVLTAAAAAAVALGPGVAALPEVLEGLLGGSQLVAGRCRWVVVLQPSLLAEGLCKLALALPLDLVLTAAAAGLGPGVAALPQVLEGPLAVKPSWILGEELTWNHS